MLIEISRADALELICVLEHISFTEEAAPRFRRFKEDLTKQLCEKSTIEQLNEAQNELGNRLDTFYFPEIIE